MEEEKEEFLTAGRKEKFVIMVRKDERKKIRTEERKGGCNEGKNIL